MALGEWRQMGAQARVRTARARDFSNATRAAVWPGPENESAQDRNGGRISTGMPSFC
ncbi:hypothetical protein GCM10022248_70990 [Nonomuraea soli]